jgi:uncharacterized protein (DUF1330 family)
MAFSLRVLLWWSNGGAPFRHSFKETTMAKAYWIAFYRAVHDPQKLAAYAKLAGPAIQAAGGKFLARGTAAHAYEAGLLQRTVLVEFPSVGAAVACHDGAAYQEALRALGKGSVDRELRIVEAAD